MPKPEIQPSILEKSFLFCREVARKQARNFYYSFLTLPKAKQDAMCAIYTWMRFLDDLADDAPNPIDASRAVQEWEEKTHRYLEKGLAEDHSEIDLWPALIETVVRYQIPVSYFDEIIEGALMDQNITRYQTFDELYQYCYRVASVVGLVCLHVFEFSDPQVKKKGEWLGIAFQLTNILRDVREDAERGRIYLPLSELKANGISENDILQKRWSPSLHDYLEKFAGKIEEYYEKSRPVPDLVAKESSSTLKIMTEIYHGILDQIRRMDYRVLEKRARVPSWKKLWIVGKYQFGLAS